jgi:hypothetical protein
MNDIQQQLIAAAQYALEQEWDAAHRIVQELHHPQAHWLHAVLHKIEGDAWNSRYWYARSHGKQYEDFSDAQQELKFLLRTLHTDQQ